MRAALLLLAGCLPDLGPVSAGAHADACGTCHPTHAAELLGSRHADASDSPVFTALRARADAELGAGARCDRCHGAFDGDRLCLACHDAAGHDEPANGALIPDPTGPVRGPWGDTTGPHASAPGLISESALCGTCHDQDGFAGFSEHPYQSWQASPAAASGERCQDCHQSPVPGRSEPRPVEPIAVDGPPRERSSHRFAGLSGPDAVTLLARGVRLTRTNAGVRVENLAGHGFPDGASFVRDLWLEPRVGGAWTGERVPLTAQLFAGDRPTWDPVAADRVVLRGLAPGEVREVPLATGSDDVCLRFRPVSEGLAVGLGLPVPEPVTVACAPA